MDGPLSEGHAERFWKVNTVAYICLGCVHSCVVVSNEMSGVS